MVVWNKVDGLRWETSPGISCLFVYYLSLSFLVSEETDMSSLSSMKPKRAIAKNDNINVDSKGRILGMDIREDEEQLEKLDAIMELLVAAGYFRARIKGLSPFDKVSNLMITNLEKMITGIWSQFLSFVLYPTCKQVIGGMTWAIEMSNVDVDVDLVFHDSLSIGQKMWVFFFPIHSFLSLHDS